MKDHLHYFKLREIIIIWWLTFTFLIISIKLLELGDSAAGNALFLLSVLYGGMAGWATDRYIKERRGGDV